MAVDEEGGGAVDARRHGGLDVGLQGLARGGVAQAGVDLGLGATADADGARVPVAGVAAGEGGGLTGHERMGHVEELARRGAAADGGGRGGGLDGLGRQVAEDQLDLARVDVASLERRQDVIGPGGAVAAGEGSVFDHRHRRIGAAQDAIGGRHGRHGGCGRRRSRG